MARQAVPRADNLQLRWLEAPAPAILVGASQRQMLRHAPAADGIMLSDMPAGPAAAALGILGYGARDGGPPPPGVPHDRSSPRGTFYPDRQEAPSGGRRWLLLRGIFRPWLLAEVSGARRRGPGNGEPGRRLPGHSLPSHEVEGVPDRVLDGAVENVTIAGSPDTWNRCWRNCGT